MTESNWNKRGSFPQTTKIFSPNISDGIDHMIINKDLSLPLIKTIQNENVLLKAQLQKIEQQILNLEGITTQLSSENSALREHYYQRNRDVQNTIQSIKINIGVQVSDINHHMHLLREGNCILFKNIQSELKKQKEVNERIQYLTKKLLDLKQGNVKMEQNVLFPLKARLQKLNKKTIQQLTQERDKRMNNEQVLTKQINDLLMEINLVQKENLKGLWKQREKKSQVEQEKQSMKGNIVNTLKSLQQLKSDIQIETNTLKQQTQNRDQLVLKSKKVEAETIRMSIELQKKMTRLNKLLSEREYQINSFDETKKSMSELELVVMKKKEQRQRLRTVLGNKAGEAKKNQSEFENLREQMEEEKKLGVFRLRVKMGQVEMSIKQQEKQLDLELEQGEWIEKGLKEELLQLKKDLKQYEQVLGRIENPGKQLQKAHAKQRLNPPRKPLFHRNT